MHPEKLMVLKIDDFRGNIVVSRRAILEEQRKKERSEVLLRKSHALLDDGGSIGTLPQLPSY